MEQSKSKKVLSIAGAVAVFFVAYFVFQYLTKQVVTEVQIANTSKKDYIDMAVSGVKNGQMLPKEVDEVTTWTDITGTSEAIQYHYTIHDIDESLLDIAVLKESMIPTLCTTVETRRFLDKEITMEYYYSVQGSSRVHTIAVTKTDCFQ